MLQPISIAEARNNFSDLLGEVYYGGKKFLIEKLGKPFAVLIGVEEYKRFEEAREYFFKKMRAERAKRKEIPFIKVEKDIAEAIDLVRKQKPNLQE